MRKDRCLAIGPVPRYRHVSALVSVEKMFVKLALRPRRHDADAEILP